MKKVYRGVSVLAFGFAVIASPSYAQKAINKTNAARSSALRTCSVLSSYKPPEHISTNIPYFTYSACMIKRGQEL